MPEHVTLDIIGRPRCVGILAAGAADHRRVRAEGPRAAFSGPWPLEGRGSLAGRAPFAAWLDRAVA